MKSISTILGLFIGLLTYAQSNLTVFNNDGRQFYVILNGIKQNAQAKTNVYVSGIKNGSYSAKIIFADGTTPDIDKNFFIDTPSDITTRIVFKDGKGKLQLIGMEPTKGTLQEQSTVVYRPDNTSVYSDDVKVNTSGSTTTTTTTTTSNTTKVSGSQNGNQSGNVNMNVGVNGNQTGNNTVNPNGNVGVNMNVNVSDPTMNGGGVNMNVNISDPTMGMGGNTTNTQTGNSTYTQTTTTTTTNTTTKTNPTTTTTTASNTASTTKICKNILSDGDAFVADINSLSFDSDKKEAILGDLATYCLTASQAYKIVETLSFESDRLEVAKFLFDRMIDKDKGNTLLPLFSFDSNKMEYREHMRKK